MSELSGERAHGSHGGSSLSIFSGVATSSASGTSDLGHVNVDELSDNSLELLLSDTTKVRYVIWILMEIQSVTKIYMYLFF